MIEKIITLMKALLYGFSVTIEDEKYGLDEKGNLLVERTRIADGKKDKIWLVVDCPLSYFMTLANKLTDKQFAKLKRDVDNA